ncbi:MAG: hypothetical protein LW822_08855 [Phycisphaeraceae bacterium]|nr:hypothetical protein [Phycisphaeraceae bacterium]
MRLPLSEIRANAMKFAAEWADASSERAEAQPFWTDLFAVFGIKRRAVAAFEEKVKNLKGAYDRIDVFYAGVMLGEHKSLGQDLSKAASQAFDYIQSLQRDGRDSEIPQYIVVSDFQTIAVYDLESPDPSAPAATFKTAKLHENIKHLNFLSGYTTKPVDPEDPINIQAVEVLGKLHDALERGGYAGHALERFLVRVLFCLFADDTAIFDNEEFKALVKDSRTDGSDLGPLLARFFKVLDQDKPDRPAKLPEELQALPYVNGDLFKEDLGFADFDAPMRAALLECCEFNWSRISPAVFGSLFQSIMAGESGARKRRQIGAHYTSERDIMKLVRSLFLDDLNAELASCGKDKKKLLAFQDKLASLRFLDPACGCGNFLVVTYRELRLLLRPARPPTPPQKIRKDRPRQRPADRLELRAPRQAVQLCAGEPAIRGQALQDKGSDSRPSRRCRRRRKRGRSRFCHCMVLYRSEVHQGHGNQGCIRSDQLNLPRGAGSGFLGRAHGDSTRIPSLRAPNLQVDE